MFPLCLNWMTVHQVDELLKSRERIHESFSTCPPLKKSGSKDHHIKVSNEEGKEEETKDPLLDEAAADVKDKSGKTKSKWFNINFKVEKKSI